MEKTIKKFSSRELSDFCGHLSMILNSGISLLEGLYMMSEDLEDSKYSQVLTTLQQEMDASGIFCEALEKAGVFPDYMVKMVKLGEQSGHLDDVMEALSEHYDREDSLDKSIRSAVAYPLMMLCMIALIVVVLLTKVMPIFNQVFMQLGTELSGLSRGLMNLGVGIRRYALLLIAVAGLLLAGGLWVWNSPKGRAAFSRLGRKIPWIAAFYDRISLCRFASGMSLTLSSGLNPEYAMELTRDLSEDPEFGKRLLKCQDEMDRGEDLSRALQNAGVFSGVYARMASIGEKTGAMDLALRRIADDCQNQVDQKIASALSLIEPTLVVVLSVIVGVVLMSVMFPLLGIMSSI